MQAPCIKNDSSICLFQTKQVDQLSQRNRAAGIVSFGQYISDMCPLALCLSLMHSLSVVSANIINVEIT